MGYKKLGKRLLAGLLTAVLAFSPIQIPVVSGYTSVHAYAAGSDVNLPANIKDGAILHAFCWSFNTIKANMADIYNAGFVAIQTSPINACESSYSAMTLSGPNGCWYYHYQPTDWKIGNYQLGTRAEFSAMCKEADKYGIKIIVDVVPNHTASKTSSVSSNLNNAAGGASKLYHSTGTTWISDYSNRLQCTRYSLSGLPDVDTENTGFQNYFISYLNDCIACGADGFRYDTAKHIGLPDDSRPSGVNNNFWNRAINEITNASKIFNYGEVLQGGNERLGDYQKAIGATTASYYGNQIRTALKNKNYLVTNVMSYCIESDASADKLVTWVESHDNYINDGTWSELTEKQVIQGWAIITAREKGTPLFFSRPKGSSTSNMWGNNVIGAAGSDAYKSAEVREVNKFRNNMIGQNEYLRNPNGSERILMIERGKKGMVIVNNSTYDYMLNGIETNLADGTYVDHITGKDVYTVSGGKITGDIPVNGIVVLYNEGSSNSSNSGNSSGSNNGSSNTNVNSASGNVYIYQDINYGGRSASLGVGDYNLASLQAKGFKNDDLSSLKVPFGTKVTLFADDNFAGSKKVITADTSWIGSDFNDKATSIRVEKIRYRIFNRNSGLCLDVANASHDSGANVQQWYENGNDAQVFEVTMNSDSSYVITSVMHGKALDMGGWSKDNGGNLIIWDNNNTDNQRWWITNVGDGYCSIINKNSGKGLDVDGWSMNGAANVQQWDYNAQANQQWKFVAQ